MIRIAAGERLTLRQQELKGATLGLSSADQRGRPGPRLLPSTGRFGPLFLPRPSGPGEVRIDTGVYEGDEIPSITTR